MKRVVFAGGSYCGKTTLLDHYKSAGYPIISEAAMSVITELKNTMGLKNYKSWRLNNSGKFFELVCKKQIQIEQNMPDQNSIIFSDRSVIDMIAIAGYHGVTLPKEIVNYAKTYQFEKIFLCELLNNFDNRPETGRIHTREDSLKIVECVYKEYKKYGYHPIRLSPISVEKRIKIINKTLGL